MKRPNARPLIFLFTCNGWERPGEPYEMRNYWLVSYRMICGSPDHFHGIGLLMSRS